MTFRLLPALCALLLAGCTSSEPKNATYAPLAADAVTLPAPVFPAAPASHPQTEPPRQQPVDHIPVQPPQPGDIADASALTDGENCRTVDEVTLCDAMADPSADDTLYTN